MKPGDHIPLDGIVLEGSGAVDESMLTGESIPIDKHADDQLIGGTMNLDGRLRMRVTALPQDTMLAKIIAMVENAQAKKHQLLVLQIKYRQYLCLRLWRLLL